MDEEITASCMLEMSLFLNAHQWYRRQKAALRLAAILILIVLALCVAQLNGWKIESLGVLAATIAGVSAGAFALVTFIQRQRMIRGIRRLPVYGELASWKFTPDGYEANVGLSTSFTVWEHVAQSVFTGDGALIYSSPVMCSWIPKTAFATESDFTAMLTLLAAKTKYSQIG